MKFKILALRLNSAFSLRKNLKPEVLYKFTNGFQFKNKEGLPLDQIKSFREIKEIKDLKYYPDNLYRVGEAGKEIDVNITAVLGRNGAGKSSLLECLYLLIFCLSERKRLITYRNVLSIKIDQGLGSEQDEFYLRTFNQLLEGAEIEVYYQIDEEFYLTMNTPTMVREFKLKNGNWDVFKYNSLFFFYTICINYSQYGLNAKGDYFWLKPLFHKNDGYKTPVVLNPFRNDGNIDMNSEAHLAQTRILTNLSHQKINTTVLIDDKTVESVVMTVRPAKIGRVEDYDLHKIYEQTKVQNNIDLITVFSAFVYYFGERNSKFPKPEWINYLKAYFQEKKSENINEDQYKPGQEDHFDPKRIEDLFCLYIIGKIVKICQKYQDVRDFISPHLNPETKEVEFWMVKDQQSLVKALRDDQSHVTLKLKQATNALVHGYIDNKRWKLVQDPESIDKWLYETTWTFDTLQQTTNAAFNGSKHKRKTAAQFVPAACLIPTIQVNSGGKSYPFQQLSSGEQQLLHSTHSIIYHVLNLDSKVNEKDNYQFINLVLDEIELYYHPKYQRDFLAFLLKKIGEIELKFIKGINIIFSTHSPFILSDIPHHNVLKLDNGTPLSPADQGETFGANIHDMLADSFFLDQGLIGKFAEETINKLITELEKLRELKELELLLKSDKTEPEIKRIRELSKKYQVESDLIPYTRLKKSETDNLYIKRVIQMIGEPIVRFKLQEMYNDVITDGQTEKDRIMRHILNLMEENGINKGEL